MDRTVAPRWTSEERLDDRYRLLRLISRGGMADVFEAEDERLQRRVAVKRFRADPVADRPRFDSEVTLLASLDHPNLVRVFDAGEHDGDAFLVLELVEGPTVADRLATGPLPPREVALLGRSVAEALAYVHDRGVVHRDVSPANILSDAEGRPRLADFGIARVLDATRRTATATTVGTAAYMAPEQVEGKDVTGAADVYSLGLILLELLSGQRAFDGPMHEVAVARLVRDPDTTLAPESWQDLLSSMTERAPEDRPTATETASRLDALAAEAPAGPSAAATMVVGAAGAAAIGDDDATQVLATAAGGTRQMPAVLAPAPEPEPEPSATASALGSLAAGLWARRVLLALVAGIALLVILVGMAMGGDDLDVPTGDTVPVTAEPTTTTLAPTTTSPPTTQAPAREGHGKGKKKGDD